MYTGIVQGSFPVRHVQRGPASLTYAVELPNALREGLTRGASVAVDGVCQTVADLRGDLVHFDAHAETLRVTTLGALQEGQRVHVERSAKPGDENGGHAVSGHVDTTLEILDVQASTDNHVLVLRVPPAFAKYVFNKGFVAIHGASLTVSAFEAETASFRVYLIPETLRLTTFGEKQVGDRLNLEIDRQTQVLVDTVERTLRTTLPALLGRPGSAHG